MTLAQAAHTDDGCELDRPCNRIAACFALQGQVEAHSQVLGLSADACLPLHKAGDGGCPAPAPDVWPQGSLLWVDCGPYLAQIMQHVWGVCMLQNSVDCLVFGDFTSQGSSMTLDLWQAHSPKQWSMLICE